MGDLAYLVIAGSAVRNVHTKIINGHNRTWCEAQCSNCKEWRTTRKDHLVAFEHQNKTSYCSKCSPRRYVLPVKVRPQVEESFWYWLAGFFDGEGCLVQGRNRGKPGVFFFTISQNDRSSLEYAMSTLGVGVIDTRKGVVPKNGYVAAHRYRVTDSEDIAWIVANIRNKTRVPHRQDQFGQLDAHMQRRVPRARNEVQ